MVGTCDMMARLSAKSESSAAHRRSRFAFCVGLLQCSPPRGTHRNAFATDGSVLDNTNLTYWKSSVSHNGGEGGKQ